MASGFQAFLSKQASPPHMNSHPDIELPITPSPEVVQTRTQRVEEASPTPASISTLPATPNISRYVSFKVFGLFRDRLIPLIEQNRVSDVKMDVKEAVKHIFLSPETLARRRKFAIRGADMPYVSIWATSPLEYNPKFYARSVLERDFVWEDKNHKKVMGRGFVYDFQKTFSVVSGSYFRDFTDNLEFHLLEIDRLRHFTFDVGELVPGFRTRMILDGTASRIVANTDEETGTRSFTLAKDYTVSITLPILKKFRYMEGLSLYLGQQQIWENKLISAVLNPTLVSSGD